LSEKQKGAVKKWLCQNMHHFPILFFQFSLSMNLLFVVYFSTGILRHLTVVRTSSLFGHVTKPAPAPVNIEKLQEEAQKVSSKE